MYDIIDVNNNGKLERKEVRDFFESMTSFHEEKPFNTAEFDANWATMDKNNDGSIDEEELYKYMRSKAIADGTL